MPHHTNLRLQQALARRDSYHYQGDGIKNKVLTTLIAPTAAGKSTIISEVLRLCAQQGLNSAEVGSLTTRPRRPASDPKNYRTANEGITQDWMVDAIEANSLINWSVSPTGDIYGTDPQSYPAEYNFLPLLPDSLPMLSRAGFRAVHTVYITVPVAQWAHQLKQRSGDPTFTNRIQEAISSLTFAKQHSSSLIFVHNQALPGDAPQPTAAAQRIIDVALGHTVPADPGAKHHIDAMLTYAQSIVQDPTHGTS